jgi:hypothetical protein
MRNTIVFEVGKQTRFQARIIVPIVERSGSTKEVQIFFALRVVQVAPARFLENRWERPTVTPDFGFHSFDCFHGFLRGI